MKTLFTGMLILVGLLMSSCSSASKMSITPVPPTQTRPARLPSTTPVSLSPTTTPETNTPAPTVESENMDSNADCGGVLTSSNQEGPYYKAGSPERLSLIEPGMPGTPVLISGHVYDQVCSPIPGAKIDFWLADFNGQYDNQGYTLRGHVFSDENGYYSIESIEPGIYTGRPPHIHVKVFAPDDSELLTTQMYFPGSEDSADVSTSPDLLVHYIETDQDGLRQVHFDFIVRQ